MKIQNTDINILLDWSASYKTYFILKNVAMTSTNFSCKPELKLFVGEKRECLNQLSSHETIDL